MYRYALIDKTLSALFAQEGLINSLNGLTNLTSEQVQEVLNEVTQSASGEDGFRASLRLYNNEEYAKGYAYNARAYLREWEGSGERENAEIRRRALDIDLKL